MIGDGNTNREGAILLKIAGGQRTARQLCGVVKAMIAGGLLLALAACANTGRSDLASLVPQPGVPQAGTSQTVPASAHAASSNEIDYRLGSGDKLRVIVFGEQDLSGEFDVTGTGKVSLPLIGAVQASGLTLDEFTSEIADKLKEGYLTNPKVSVEVLNYRPFYIIGEVDKPGEYPYTNGMNVLNAVAVAGGYTYRANQDQVYITRGGKDESQFAASQSVPVLPGDIVRVPERFF